MDKEIKEALIEWNEAREASMSCPDMILSSGKTDEAAKRMERLRVAENRLRYLIPDETSNEEHVYNTYKKAHDLIEEAFSILNDTQMYADAAEVNELISYADFAKERANSLRTTMKHNLSRIGIVAIIKRDEDEEEE